MAGIEHEKKQKKREHGAKATKEIKKPHALHSVAHSDSTKNSADKDHYVAPPPNDETTRKNKRVRRLG